MIVVVGAIKGGVGKSLICSNLVVIRALLGRRVLLVDTDFQMTVSDWTEQRREYSPDSVPITTIQLTHDSLHKEIQDLSKNFDDVIIDAGGRESRQLRRALVIADKFLIPFPPRSFDVWTLEQVENLYSEIRAGNPKLEALSFINKSDLKGNDLEYSRGLLSKSPNIKLLDANIGSRKAFSNAASQGLGVVELKGADRKAIQEIQKLHDLIYC